MLTRFHGLLDSRLLTIPEHRGETIEAHRDFLFLGTLNDTGDGSRPLTARMRDRFPIVLDYQYDRAVEARLCPDESLLELFDRVRRDPRIRTPASTRLICSVLDNLEVFGPTVARMLFVNHFRPDERPVVSALLEESPVFKSTQTLGARPPVLMESAGEPRVRVDRGERKRP